MPFKGTRKSEEASTVDSKTMRVGKGVRGSTPSALRSGRGDNFTVAIHDSTTADSNNHRSCSIYFKNRHIRVPLQLFKDHYRQYARLSVLFWTKSVAGIWQKLVVGTLTI